MKIRCGGLILIVTAVLISCGGSSGDTETTSNSDDDLLEVTARHDADSNRHLFELSSKNIPSGWTNIRFTNGTAYDHFFVIYRAPEEAMTAAQIAGESILEHWFKSITTPFQLEYDQYVDSAMEYGAFVDNLVASISEMGPWFLDPGALPMGGPGFTAAGAISETTVFLEQGDYIVECYVKNEDEQFHSYLGMLEHLSVTGDENGVPEPGATVNLVISSESGIEVDEEIQSGSQTVEILFQDQTAYGHLLGHNVQLVKLQDKNDTEVLDQLALWMNWSVPGSLVNRAPGNARFMGGTMQMMAGSKAYFHTEMEPGDYAWIAEVPDPAGLNMLKTFTVSE